MDALKGSRILVVEDEPILLMTLEDLLVEWGCEVIAAVSSVQEGLAIANTVHCDAAILDVNINGERSDAIAERLSQRRIPCIFTTGYGHVEPHGGMAVILAKPYEPAVLLSALKQAIASHQPR